MIEKIAPHPNTTGISQELLKASIERFVQIAKEKSSAGSADGKVFILPPDFTRFHSRAGEITSLLYDIMPAGGSTWSVTDIMPALGTHAPMSEDQVGGRLGGRLGGWLGGGGGWRGMIGMGRGGTYYILLGGKHGTHWYLPPPLPHLLPPPPPPFPPSAQQCSPPQSTQLTSCESTIGGMT